MIKVTKQAFFNPFVGSNYHKGISGKKILVLGASFYCPKTECSFFSRCTNTTIKDSSPYDRICPVYSANGICLHDEPANSIENWYPTYQTFAKGLEQFVGYADYDNIWSHLAFTNYVQFFLPSNGDSFRTTKSSDLSERDFEALIEVVKELSPDIVIVWGCVINTSVKENNKYVFDKDKLKQNEDYLCHMRVPGVNHDIAIVNPNHPSSASWHSDKERFLFYLSKALNE